MRILSIGCLLMLALAGCTDEANEPESPDVVMDDAPSQNNTAPAPQLDADIVNGTAPLLVNFTITATDVDGDNLTWVFEAHANGTMVANATGNQSAFPAQVNATFEANGTATLTVSDGTNSTTVSVNITAIASAGAAVEDAGDAVDPNAPEDRGAFIF
ncbi:MAG: Ig-like domain-containing protein, partial [Thermoplasmatota archaeon]